MSNKAKTASMIANILIIYEYDLPPMNALDFPAIHARNIFEPISIRQKHEINSNEASTLLSVVFRINGLPTVAQNRYGWELNVLTIRPRLNDCG